MSLLLFFFQTTVSSPDNAQSADPFKNWAQVVAIIGGVAGGCGDCKRRIAVVR